MKKIATSLLLIFLSINPALAESVPKEDSLAQQDTSVYDPLESLNRYTFSFNKGVDTYGIKPITIFYKENTPKTFQKEEKA